MTTSKAIRIAAAIVLNDRGHMLVVRKRGTTAFIQPGGKIEPGETPEEALAREIREELLCEVTIGELIVTSTHSYDFAEVTLSTYLCELTDGEPELTEHTEALWQPLARLDELDWAPVDYEAVALLMRLDA